MSSTPLGRSLSEDFAPPPPPPLSPDTPNFTQLIDWTQLAIVLGSLYLVCMVAVMFSACYCRQRQQAPQQFGGVEAGQPQPTAANGGLFQVHNANRAKSWREAQRMGQYANIDAIERSIKMAFVRKVYSILATQLALTVAIVMAFLYLGFQVVNGAPDPTKLTSFGLWVFSNYIPSILIAFIPLIICICWLQSAKNRYPLNFVLLFVFTIIESITLGFFCLFLYRLGYGSEILLAFGITMAIFCVLTLFTKQSKIDWSFLGPAIFCCIFVLIFWSWFTFWLVPAASFVPRQLLSLFGAIVFSLFIVYDTNNIMKHFGVDDYIIAAIELYLDVVNLFRYLLMCLVFSGGGRD